MLRLLQLPPGSNASKSFSVKSSLLLKHGSHDFNFWLKELIINIEQLIIILNIVWPVGSHNMVIRNFPLHPPSSPSPSGYHGNSHRQLPLVGNHLPLSSSPYGCHGNSLPPPPPPQRENRSQPIL